MSGHLDSALAMDVAVASHPESPATSGTSAPIPATLASVRRQRAALSRQLALISEGHRLCPLGTKLQRLRSCQPLAREAAVATRVAQLLSDQIVALEQDVRGELLYMHALLCEELREHERKTEREAAKFRRRLLVGAARKRLQLLALFGEEEAGVRLLPHSILLPAGTDGHGGVASRSIAVPMPTIADSGRIQAAMAAVVVERWNVMNPTLEMALVASREAEGASTRSRHAEGYVAVPSDCIERFLLAGILCGEAAAHATMAGGPPSQRRVRGQLGQHRQEHCAELVSRTPEIVLSGGPHACLAACLSECEANITTAGGRHGSDLLSGPTVGYAVRCSVALAQCQNPPAHRKGAAVLSGSPELGSAECLAVSPHEVIMFVLEERQLLEQCEAAVELHTVDSKPTDTLRAEKAANRPPKGKEKHTGKHNGIYSGDIRPSSLEDEERGVRAVETAAPQAARTAAAMLQAGISPAALPHCTIVTDLLGQLHAEDAEHALVRQADNGTAPTADFVYSGSGNAAVVSSSSSRGGWRVPAYSGSDLPRPSVDGKSRPLYVTSGRWRQAEARLQQAIRTAGLIPGSSSAELSEHTGTR